MSDELTEGKTRIDNKEDLMDLLHQHKTWLVSEGNRGKRLEIDRLVLSGVSLAGADFRRSSINEARLSGCDLAESMFDGAEVKTFSANGCSLGNSSFRGSTLGSFYLKGCSAPYICLLEAHADNVEAHQTDLTWSVFDFMRVGVALFSETNLNRSSFIGAKLDVLTVRRSDLFGASFRASTVGDGALVYSDIFETDFTGASADLRLEACDEFGLVVAPGEANIREDVRVVIHDEDNVAVNVRIPSDAKVHRGVDGIYADYVFVDKIEMATSCSFFGREYKEGDVILSDAYRCFSIESPRTGLRVSRPLGVDGESKILGDNTGMKHLRIGECLNGGEEDAKEEINYTDNDAGQEEALEDKPISRIGSYTSLKGVNLDLVDKSVIPDIVRDILLPNMYTGDDTELIVLFRRLNETINRSFSDEDLRKIINDYIKALKKKEGIPEELLEESLFNAGAVLYILGR